MSVQISPAEYFLTVEKIAKINARAAKKGWTGRVTLEAVETTKVTNVEGFEVREQVWDVTLGGEAPSYNGWTFLATLDWDENAGLITRCAPGVEVVVERDSLVAGWCDHCKTSRYRKATFLVLNQSTGEQVQVGSTCVKDFLGWTGSFTFLSEDEVQSEMDIMWGAGSSSDRNYSVETVLAVAWAAVKAYGWVPASAGDYKMTTKSAVLTFLNPSTRINHRTGRLEDAELVEAVGAHVDGSADAAAKARAYILSDDFSGDSEYVVNMKAVVSAEFVSSRNIGLVASAPQALARFEEKTLARKAAAEGPQSAWFGTKGDKGVLFTGVIEAIRYIDSQWGSTVLYTFRAADGTIAKWFASSEALGDTTVIGTTVTIKGTIKDHEEFKGTKSTVLTRCKQQV